MGALKKRAVGASPLMAARTFAMTMPTCIANIPIEAGLAIAVAGFTRLCASRHLGLHILKRRSLSCSLDKAQALKWRQPMSGSYVARKH